MAFTTAGIALRIRPYCPTVLRNAHPSIFAADGGIAEPFFAAACDTARGLGCGTAPSGRAIRSAGIDVDPCRLAGGGGSEYLLLSMAPGVIAFAAVVCAPLRRLCRLLQQIVQPAIA